MKTLVKKPTALLMATLVAFGVMSGTTQAFAANEHWGTEGFGWFSHGGNNIYNAYDRMDITPEYATNPDGSYDVTYTIDFNKKRNPNAFSGRPWFFVYLPASLQEDTIQITRMREKVSFGRDGTKYMWDTVGDKQTIIQYHETRGISRSTHKYPEQGFMEDWANGVNSTDNLKGKETVCSVTKWKNEGKFSRSLWSYEKGDNVRHKWIITGTIAKGHPPILQPIVAGYTSSNTFGWDNLFAAYGPYDTDGDGVADTQELAMGTNQAVTGDHVYEKKQVKANEVATSQVKVKTGKFDTNNGKFTYDANNQSKNLTEFNGATRTLDTSKLPAGVTVTQNRNPMPGEVYFDPQTAELIFHPADVHKGQKVNFSVNFTYEPKDHCSAGQTETVTATFNVAQDAVVNNATVTFMNENSIYKKVQVEKGKSIDTDALTAESMPDDPLKKGHKFVGWNLAADGQGPFFTGDTKVSEDTTVYAVYRNNPPKLEVRNETITVGSELDLRNLITKASDEEDGQDLTANVEIDPNGFNKDVAGTYTVKFKLTDQGNLSVMKEAMVTVNPKSTPSPKPDPNPNTPSSPAPAPNPNPSVPGSTPTPDPAPNPPTPTPELKPNPQTPDPNPNPPAPNPDSTPNLPAPTPEPVPNLPTPELKPNPQTPAPQRQPEKHIGMLPKTGESASFAGLLAAIGFSIAGLAILLKKKMMEENK